MKEILSQSKLDRKNALYLIEIYRSVQGETSFTGIPTIFVRLAGCNLRCSWCDTPYSFGRGEPKPVDAVIEEISGLGCKHVCITGGEPLLQRNVFSLISQLCQMGHIVSIETGGSLSIEEIDPLATVILDIKCPGSGMEHKNLFENIDRLRPHDEVKFVIQDAKDYAYAKEIIKKHKLESKVKEVLISPVHGVLDPKTAVDWILEDNLKARLNLQVHKYIWYPETKGV